MSLSLDFLVKVLQLELKEVEHDLTGLKELYANRHERSEITHYVFLENTAVLQSELNSIHTIGTLLDDIKIDSLQNPYDFIDSIDEYIKLEIDKRQFSKAIYDFVKLKLTKVSKYLDM